MTRASLRGRLRALERHAAKEEDPRRVYLRALLSYLPKARAARHGGDAAQAQEAEALRARLEALSSQGPA